MRPSIERFFSSHLPWRKVWSNRARNQSNTRPKNSLKRWHCFYRIERSNIRILFLTREQRGWKYGGNLTSLFLLYPILPRLFPRLGPRRNGLRAVLTEESRRSPPLVIGDDWSAESGSDGARHHHHQRSNGNWRRRNTNGGHQLVSRLLDLPPSLLAS